MSEPPSQASITHEVWRQMLTRYAERAAEAERGRPMSECGAASEHQHMAEVEHLRRCPICDLRLGTDR